MRVLIVGNGGREHALLWRLRQDAPEAQFYVTQPNGGMTGTVTPVEIAPTDIEALAGWAASRQIDLAVVGPEAPLASGLVNRFRVHGVPAFGPTKEAARIESSKAYAKDLMDRAGVPTAEYGIYREVDPAKAFARELGAPLVVKVSGLAAGKGAIICDTLEEADAALERILVEHAFGEAGREVVLEEFMRGEELSIFALADGTRAVPLVGAQDHKRVGEGDVGPNTGGMGAYAPVSLDTASLLEEVQARILEPTLSAMAEDGNPFRGLLYAGLMITDAGPKVVEFNCRFGDPESQVILPLTGGSLLHLMSRIAEGDSVAGEELPTRPGAALTTVLASGGYPGEYQQGQVISIPPDLDEDGDILVFHAGTTMREGNLTTSGGRVLAVTGTGATLEEAARVSRSAATRIEFSGRQFRTDIGWRELTRKESP